MTFQDRKRGPKSVPAEERFFKYVQRWGFEECWLWTGTREDVGYGQFWHEGRNIKAHRFAWTMIHGEPPENYRVVQTCRNRLCVNPEHLELLSPWEKSAQMRAAKPSLTLEERFWSKVQKQEGDGCWIWIGSKDGSGYGQLHLDRKRVLAHRIGWQLENGPIPEGMDILHNCDNPPCVRSSHLRTGSHLENLQEASRKGRFPNNGIRKLSDDQVREIRRRAADKSVSRADLARDYGVTPPWISAIVSRRKRSDVT